MIEIQFELRDFERQTRQLGAAFDQIPFALSRALNDAAKTTRQHLIDDTWPQHVTVRSRGFLKWALLRTFATKSSLRVEIHDERAQGRGHLLLHAKGGAKIARKRLAIPPKGTVSRTASGVRKSQRPAAIIARTPKRSLRITAGGIFVGKGGRLVLKYLFRRSVNQPADVPFVSDFGDMMRRLAHQSFTKRMKEAMSSRRG